MNVLYLNHASGMSGAEQSLRALMRELRQSHPEISPVLALPGEGDFSRLMRDEEWDVVFAPLHRIQRPTNAISGMTALFRVASSVPFISRLVENTHADIIHSNSTTAHIAGGLAGERCIKPTIWHVRDLVSLGRIAPALASRATRIIAISGCVAEHLQQQGVSAEQIRVIHNGIDPEEWQPRESSQWRAAMSFADADFVFGCLAQMIPWKNHQAFIEAAAQLHNHENCSRARFVIAGGNLWEDGREYSKQLREQVKSLGLQDRFNFVPHQNDNIDLMAGLDALVLPSHEEPFGRVLIEAMAMQKTVIAYANGGPLEIVTHEHDGLLVSPDETDGLANAMKRLLHENDLREHLQNQARETVLQKFHIREHAAKVQQLYYEVL